jgi:CRISPR-associated protein Csd1
MILRALAAYYDRLLAEGAIQPPGFQEKKLPWIVEIHPDGRFRTLIATDDGTRGERFVVSMEVKKSVNIAANLLWDTPEYVFGVARDGANAKQAAKVPLRHAAFLDRLRVLAEAVGDDAGLAAVRTFLEAGDFADLTAAPRWPEVTRTNGLLSFRLVGDAGLICDRPAVRAAIAALAGAEENDEAAAPCLVTGRRATPARLHPSVRGVRGAQPTGANLVSFNLDAVESHGWRQGQNAPVGRSTAQAYVAALNHLLRRESDSRHCVQGDVTVVVWAAAPTALEDDMAALFGARARSGEADGLMIRDALTLAKHDARPPAFDDPTPFHVLALAPNASRLAVRLWYEGTVGALLERFSCHFADLSIDGFDARSETPGLWRLLCAAAIGGELKHLPDALRGTFAVGIMTAILEDTPYPAPLLARVVARCRAERAVFPVHAALIKASLNRRARPSGTSPRPITVSLDPDNTNPGYLLGRLLAVLERVQRTGRPGGARSLRDRAFGTAMTAPNTVLAALKTRPGPIETPCPDGPKHGIESLIDAILGLMPAGADRPDTLSLDDQARFILGYHHQRMAFRPIGPDRP